MSRARRVSALILVLTAAVAAAPAFATTPAGQVYDEADWVKFACTTYPLNTSTTPLGTGVQNPNVVYTEAKFWDVNDNGQWGTSDPNAWSAVANGVFDGYDFARATFTDSAAAITALATGQKTFNNAINWSDGPPAGGVSLATIVEFANGEGKKTGTISSVQFAHATPAGMSNAHDPNRNNYLGISTQMVYGTGGTVQNPAVPVLDVIMGCGHPDYNNDGGAKAGFGSTNYVAGAAGWADMGGGAGGTTSSGFQVFHTQAAFTALETSDATSGRYLGIPQVNATLQYNRSGMSAGEAPFTDAFIATVPTLESMTKASLNILDGTAQAPNNTGFFLHVEGGAIDWANHAGHLGRMIEEQIDFNKSVKAVHDYLSANGGAGTNGNNWSNTLVILTADHECGFLLGPDALTEAYDGLVNQGAGTMPLHKYMSTNHTNALVPVYAKGPGSELFAGLVDGTDAQMVSAYDLWQGFDGKYVDNTDIFTVMAEAMDGDGDHDAKNVILMISDGAGFNAWTASTMYEHGVPEPATMALLALGGAGLLLRRRRRS